MQKDENKEQEDNSKLSFDDKLYMSSDIPAIIKVWLHSPWEGFCFALFCIWGWILNICWKKDESKTKE